MSQSHSRKVVMVGTSLNAPGGMTSVVRSYRDFGFFAAHNVNYLSSYEKPGLKTQLAVMAKALTLFVRMLRANEVALLHVHSASRGSFWRKSIFCALARVFGVPYIFHIHSGEFPVFVKNECGTMARKWVMHTLHNAQHVIALTGTWRTEIEALAPGAHVTVLGNPVTTSTQISSRKLPADNILFLGRLREKKGIFDLVNAIPIVLRSVPLANFVLAGDGDLAGVAERAAALGITHAVKLPGWVDGAEKDALLAQASVLALPSYFEGLPVCILEAMALGVPVVATAVGGIPDVLESGASGSLVQPGAVEELALAIVQLLHNNVTAEAMRLRAFKRAQDFYSPKAIFAALTAIYNGSNSEGGVA